MGNRIPTKARRIVKDREENRCLRCGGRGTDIHHRKRRREGGHGLANLVLLCRRCHDDVHGNPRKARETGFIVSVAEEDPSTVPLRTWTRDWQTNYDDGDFTLSREKEHS